MHPKESDDTTQAASTDAWYFTQASPVAVMLRSADEDDEPAFWLELAAEACAPAGSPPSALPHSVEAFPATPTPFPPLPFGVPPSGGI